MVPEQDAYGLASPAISTAPRPPADALARLLPVDGQQRGQMQPRPIRPTALQSAATRCEEL